MIIKIVKIWFSISAFFLIGWHNSSMLLQSNTNVLQWLLEWITFYQLLQSKVSKRMKSCLWYLFKTTNSFCWLRVFSGKNHKCFRLLENFYISLQVIVNCEIYRQFIVKNSSQRSNYSSRYGSKTGSFDRFSQENYFLI